MGFDDFFRDEYCEEDFSRYDPENRLTKMEMDFRYGRYTDSELVEKLPQSPIDWSKNGIAFARALQLPESVEEDVFIAVCLRYLKLMPSLLQEKFMKAGLSRELALELMDYLSENFDLLERIYFNQLQIVDKYFRFECDKNKKVKNISVPEKAEYYLDLTQWIERRHRRNVDSGPEFDEYLKTEFEKSVDACLTDDGTLDEETLAKEEEEFAERQEELYRQQIYNQERSADSCRCKSGNKHDSHAPLAKQMVSYYNWHKDNNTSWQEHLWARVARKFEEFPEYFPNLKEKLIVNPAGFNKPAYILCPTIRFGEFDKYDYFIGSTHASHRLEENCDLKKRFLSELDSTHILRQGSLLEVDEDTLQIRMGIRRPERPGKKTIAKGLYLFDMVGSVDHGEGGWRGDYPEPAFYTKYLAGHLAENKTADPFEWALKEVQTAAGYVDAIRMGGDYPIYHFQHQFMEMAPIVCNATPEVLVEPRQIKLTPEKGELLAAARAKLKELFCPEIGWLILENADLLTPEIFEDGEFLDLLAKIPACLQNGLVIDRLQDLIEIDGGKTGSGGRGRRNLESIKFSLKIIVDIFLGKEPWWFKEDFDLCGSFDRDCDKCQAEDGRLKIGYCEDGKKLISDIAKEAGFAFAYAVELYKTAGFKMATIPGVDPEDSLKFVCEIAKKFGIGNLKRAVSIIEFAVANVMEVDPEERVASLERFKKIAGKNAPQSEVLGRMEGEEATLNLPGMTALMSTCLGQERVAYLKLDDHVITPDVIAEVYGAMAASPLNERAALLPGFINGKALAGQSLKLLVGNVSGGILMPPGAAIQDSGQSGSELLSSAAPLNSIFKFFELVEKECGFLEKRIIELYFSMYAHKFPDPFAPPKGFLKFLQEFKRIPDGPELLCALTDKLCASPYDLNFALKRSVLSQKINTLALNRDLIITNLLDAFRMGLLTWEELDEIFKWMVEEPTSDQIREGVSETSDVLDVDDDSMDGDLDADDLTDEGGEVGAARFARREREEIEDKLKLKRLKMVEDGVEFIAAVNLLVNLGLIKTEDFREIVSSHFKMIPLTESYFPYLEDAPGTFSLLNNDSLEEVVKILEKLSSWGIFDVEAFSGQILSANSFEERRRLVQDFFLSVGAYKKSMAIFHEYDRDIKAAFKNGVNATIIADKIKELEEKIRFIWSLTPHVADKVVNIIFDEAFKGYQDYLEGHAYMRIMRILAGTRSDVDSASGEAGNMPYRPRIDHNATDANVALANGVSRLALTTIAAAHALVLEPELPRTTTEITLQRYSVIDEPKVLAVAADNREMIDAGLRIYRMESLGLLTIGGKIHIKGCDDFKLMTIKELLGLNSTNFHLAHMDNAILLPASLSPFELKALIYLLAKAGVADLDNLQFQVTIPGRLSNDNVAILGSAVLLATETGYRYSEDSFCTTHSETGARIMLYDANGKSTAMPFMGTLKGRTDMLGRMNLNDIDTYQLVGTVLAHGQFGGPFSKFTEEFKKRYVQILQKYGLDEVLDGNWIFTDAEELKDDRENKKHHQTVTMVTDAYFECADNFSETGKSEGIIFELRELLDWLKQEIKGKQKELCNDKSTCKEAALVVNL